MAARTPFGDARVTYVEQHGRRLLCILCQERSEWLFSYAKNLAWDAMQYHTKVKFSESLPLSLQEACRGELDDRWHDKRRLIEVAQTSVPPLRDLKVLGMGSNVEKRERAGSLAFAAAAFALQREAALPDPSADGEFPALVAKVRQLLLVPFADSSSSSSSAVIEVREPRHGEAPDAVRASQANRRSPPLPRSHGSEDEPTASETVEAPPQRTFGPTVAYDPAAESDAEGNEVGYQHQTETQAMDPADPFEAVPAPDEAPAVPPSVSMEATTPDAAPEFSQAVQPDEEGDTQLDAIDLRAYQNDNDIISRMPERQKSMLRRYFRDWHTGLVWEYYVGTLESVNEAGYGYVESVAAMNDWGMHIYVHKNHVPRTWTLGEYVEFAVSVNTRGQVHAVDMKWLQ